MKEFGSRGGRGTAINREAQIPFGYHAFFCLVTRLREENWKNFGLKIETLEQHIFFILGLFLTLNFMNSTSMLVFFLIMDS
ncbi:unnamed protein product [Trifolium pratense]|uniref:Uncharacterized protein n=1 Tax=Trifolium pratense TaxID=57577 RepID=A0ACB0I7P9_TRIPR|nr:unnamed protein product [Trifolium pratense]